MDAFSFDDARARRGMEMLQGKHDRPSNSADERPFSSPSSRPIIASPQTKMQSSPSTVDASFRTRGKEGLDLGRRLVVVVKPEDSDRPSTTDMAPDTQKPNSGHQQVVRVVDHGAQQKEAVKRLFDTTVLLKSYEQQLKDTEDEGRELKKKLTQATKRKAAMLPAGSPGVSAQTRADAEDDRPSKDDKEEIGAARELKSNMTVGDGTNRRNIPFWLRNDEKSRAAVERERGNLMKEYMNEGHLDTKLVIEHLWQVGMDFALRWGGSPDEEIVKQNQAIEQRSRRIQRDALEESSMLRQHLKRLEKKYRELAEAYQKLQKSGSRSGARRGSALAGGGGVRASFVGQTNGGVRGSICPAGPSMDPGMGSTGGTAAGRASGRASGVQRIPEEGHSAGAGMETHAGQLGAAVGGQASAASSGGASATPGRVNQSAHASEEFGARATGGVGESFRNGGAGDFSDGHSGGGSTGGASSYRGSHVRTTFSAPEGFDDDVGLHISLAEDDTLAVQVNPEELESLDHEIFEPMNAFDEELRELLIDVVNEKVRRILAMDPSKFKGGRLPFGLRPDKLDPETYSRVGNMEAEIDQLKEEILRLTEDKEQLMNQLEASQRSVAHLKGQRAQQQQAMAQRKRTSDAGGEGADGPAPGGGAMARRAREMHFGDRSSPEDELEPVSGIVDVAALGLPPDAAAKVKKVTDQLHRRIAALEAQLRENGIQPTPAKTARAGQSGTHANQEPSESILGGDDDSSADAGASRRGRGRGDTGGDVNRPRREAHDIDRRASDGSVDLEESIPGVAIGASAEEKAKAAMKHMVLANRLTKISQETWRNAFVKISAAVGLKGSQSQKAVEKLIGAQGKENESEAARAKDNAPFQKAVPAFEDWAAQLLEAISGSIMSNEAGSPRSIKGVRGTPQAAAGTGGDESGENHTEHVEELESLKKRCNDQQTEISRLLLTIDELRARIEKVKGIAGESTAEVAGAINGAMSKAGLKDIMDAGGPGGGYKLKGVFERLYQDAVQRIQRHGLIREQLNLANRAYSNFVNTIADKLQVEEPVPDLERLSSTAAAALQGMWYHTEFLFKNACDYAIAQGVEYSLLKGQMSLADLVDLSREDASTAAPTATGSAVSTVGESPEKRCHGKDRLPGRRGGERPRYPGTVGSDGRAFWNTLRGGLGEGPKSPRELRKDKLTEPEPTAFAAYISRLREARGDVKPDDWSRNMMLERKMVKNSGGLDFFPKTLKASIGSDSLSRSLPALPKTRSCLMANAEETGFDSSLLEQNRPM